MDNSDRNINKINKSKWVYYVAHTIFLLIPLIILIFITYFLYYKYKVFHSDILLFSAVLIIFYIFYFTRSIKSYFWFLNKINVLPIQNKELLEKRLYHIEYGYGWDYFKKHWHFLIINFFIIIIYFVLALVYRLEDNLVYGMFGIAVGLFTIINNYRQSPIIIDSPWYRFNVEASPERALFIKMITYVLGFILLISGVALLAMSLFDF
ncbi:MAG: hypothetical protein V1684_00205 [bacterium]